MKTRNVGSCAQAITLLKLKLSSYDLNCAYFTEIPDVAFQGSILSICLFEFFLSFFISFDINALDLEHWS